MIDLEILAKEAPPRRWSATAFPCRVGRGRSADLQLKSPGVWDQHAEIRLETPSHDFHLQALGEARVTLNDEPVREARLRSGDRIGLGSVTLRVALAQAASRSFAWREGLTWIGFALLALGQVALIYWLPG